MDRNFINNKWQEKATHDLIKYGKRKIKFCRACYMTLGILFIIFSIPVLPSGLITIIIGILLIRLSISYKKALLNTDTKKTAPTVKEFENNVQITEVVKTEQPTLAKSEKNCSFRASSLFDLTNDYVVIDLETTGLSHRYNEIIEIATIKVIDNETVDSFSSLIKPIKNVPKEVTELTGISNEMLVNAPSIEEILPNLRSFIGDNMLIGHNINFDIGFLFDAFMEHMGCALNNRYIDTLSISRFLYPYEKNHKLTDLKQRLNIQSEQAHRALGDVITTLNCYKKMLQYASENDILLKRADFVKRIERTYEKRSFPIVSARDLQPEIFEFDKGTSVFGKTFVFTGELECFSRKEAMQIILNMGGNVKDNVTMKTDFLVLGDNSENPLVRNGISSKQKKAEEYQQKGCNIEIISESDFKHLIDF